VDSYERKSGIVCASCLR